MAQAGQYPTRLRRLVRSTSKDAANGQDEETFTPGAYYWCRVEMPNGRRQRDYGAIQTGADVTVFVRNYPTLTALDRLTDGNTTLILESVRAGENEWICEANYFDDLDV
jgi:head-tail adaptor